MAEEVKITHEQILEMPLGKYIAKHPKKFKITDPHGWPYMLRLSIYNPYDKKFHHLSDIRQGDTVHDQGRPYIESSRYIFLDTWDSHMCWCDDKMVNGHLETFSADRALFPTRGVDKTWFDTMTPKQLDEIYDRFLGFYKNVADWIKADKAKRKADFKKRKEEVILAAKSFTDMTKYLLTNWKKAKCPDDYEFLKEIDGNWRAIRDAKSSLETLIKRGERLNPAKKPEATAQQ